MEYIPARHRADKDWASGQRADSSTGPEISGSALAAVETSRGESDLPLSLLPCSVARSLARGSGGKSDAINPDPEGDETAAPKTATAGVENGDPKEREPAADAACGGTYTEHSAPSDES